MKINGQTVDIETINLLEYLTESGYDPKKIAVECNEEIVPKSQYASFILHSGDVVEIVSLVGGG